MAAAGGIHASGIAMSYLHESKWHPPEGKTSHLEPHTLVPQHMCSLRNPREAPGFLLRLKMTHTPTLHQ